MECKDVELDQKMSPYCCLRDATLGKLVLGALRIKLLGRHDILSLSLGSNCMLS